MGARGMTPPPRTDLPDGGGMVPGAQQQMPSRTPAQSGGKPGGGLLGGMPLQAIAGLLQKMQQRQPQYSPTGVPGGPQANFQNSMNAMRAIQSQGQRPAPSMQAPWIANRPQQPVAPAQSDIDARIAAALQAQMAAQAQQGGGTTGGGN